MEGIIRSYIQSQTLYMHVVAQQEIDLATGRLKEL